MFDSLEYNRRYREEHREELRVYRRRYYLANRIAIDKQQDEYRARPRGDTYAWIKAARKQAGVTQQRLAAAAGCSPAHISRLECGKCDASAELLERIAHALQQLVEEAKK